MPKSIQYKPNSIVYFKGDKQETIYILNSGKVSLKYNDIETGQELNEVIKTGEFFGVKSALGKYAREETAVVMQDSNMIVFTVVEFEKLVLNNTRIIMKMLKVFSNQLRRLHKQVRNLLSKGEQDNPETGLYRIGEYYLKCNKNRQALYTFKRYLTYYPSGKHSAAAAENLQIIEGAVQGLNTQAAAVSTVDSSKGKELSEVAKNYYNSVSLFSQQKYSESLREFKKIISNGSDEEYEAKSQFEVGRCLFSLNEHEKCIQHYTSMIQKYPKHSELIDALFYVGKCYEIREDTAKAKGFYNKILAMASEDTPVYRKAKKGLRKIEGK